MVNLSDYAIFRESLSTLKTTSVDDHDSLTQNFMTGSERTVVDFDLVKERYIEHLGLSDIPKSNDALLDAGEGKLVFIEFKNGYIDKRMQFDIRRKIYDSTLIFSDIVSAGISSMRQYMEYILVYNEKSNSRNPEAADKKKSVQESASYDDFARKMGNLAKEEYVGFGIKMFEKYCFKKVHTYTETEFEAYLEAIGADG